MTFASIEYLIFLPVVFLLYWIGCRKIKNLQNGLIVLASLISMASGTGGSSGCCS